MSKNYQMSFRVQNIDVITRRNKYYEPCMEDLNYYDYHFIQNWMRRIGCHPPHWRFRNKYELNVCTNASQLKNFSEQPDTADIESFVPPCKMIDQLDYTYLEHDLSDYG